MKCELLLLLSILSDSVCQIGIPDPFTIDPGWYEKDDESATTPRTTTAVSISTTTTVTINGKY